MNNLRRFLLSQPVDRLGDIYEANVGERRPASSGALVDFLVHHYWRYPQDLQLDFPCFAN